MRIRATVPLDKKQIEELIFSLNNNERVFLELDFEFNNSKDVNAEESAVSFQTPQDIWDKIKEIANQSKDYEDFIDNILSWLDLGRYRDYFRNAIYCAERAERITWDGLELLMLDSNMGFLDSDRRNVSKKLSKKLKNVMNGPEVIKAVIKYKKHNFIK